MYGGGAPVTGVVLMAPSVVLSTADSVIWFGTTMACHVPCRGWYATNVPLPSPSQYMLVSALLLVPWAGCPLSPPLLSPSPFGLSKWSRQVFATLVAAWSWLSSS